MESNKFIKGLREEAGMNRKNFSEYTGIPLRTLEDWEAGRRNPPEYLVRLLSYYIEIEFFQKIAEKSRNVNVIKDLAGNNIVLIHDICFKGKRSVNWKEVQEYLRICR